MAIQTITTTDTTITTAWTLPFVPQTYQGYRHCRRLCEMKFGLSVPSNSAISSPYIFTDINPATYCIVGLNGIYGIDVTSLSVSTRIATTLSTGKLCYIIIFTIIILFLHYLQHPLHLSVISLYHQLRQGP